MLKIKELAARLNIAPMTAWKLVKAGKIRAHRVGASWRVPLESVAEYLAAGRNAPGKTDEEGEK